MVSLYVCYYLFNLPIKCSDRNGASLATRLYSQYFGKTTHLYIAHVKQSLHQETPKFISLDLWQIDSPNHNPIDYKIWGLMQDPVF